MIQEEIYGTLNGKEVTIYSVEFPGKLKAQVMSYGAILISLEIPDKKGELGDVVLGYDNLDDYVKKNRYFGTIVGRHAGRIAKGKFAIDEVEYQVTVNNGPNHNHGGNQGFDKVIWDTESVKQDADEVAITFSHQSPGGTEGFPGNVKITAKYIFSPQGFSIEYGAETDQTTMINLTNHSYFNLGGMKREALDHELFIDSSQYLELDTTSIPTGIIKSVQDTPFDFRKPKEIGRDIEVVDPQLKIGSGYDHSFVVPGYTGKDMITVAKLYHNQTGRYLEVSTTEPSIHLYTANYLDESVVGKNGVGYPFRFGVCLETQHFPNSPNEPTFPSVRLEPGEIFYSKTSYLTGVE